MSASPSPDTSVVNSSFTSDTSSISNGSTNYNVLILQPESPLDVLSRAASMVESSSSTSPNSSPTNNSKMALCARSPSFKERHPKFRKNNHSAPEYLIAAADHHASSRLTHSHQRLNPPTSKEKENHDIAQDANPAEEEGPLDMSIKKPRSDTPPLKYPPLYLPSANRAPPPPYDPVPRPPPPSYESSIVKCSYPSTNTVPKTLEEGLTKVATTPSVTVPPNIKDVLRQSMPDKNERTIKEITIITDSSADPLLDEHFRRSLGENYKKLFKNKDAPENMDCDTEPSKSPGSQSVNDKTNLKSEDKTVIKDPVKAFQEDMELEGYTVEDHFAKALGQETWLKLQNAKRKSPTGHSLDEESNSDSKK